MRTKLFAHSWLDGLMVLLAFGQFALQVAGVVTFGTIPLGTSLLIGLAAAFLMFTDYENTAHNFIHTPFFASSRLNAAFSVFNSLLIGTSQSLYRVHHLHHHKHNNDRIDPTTGTTRDRTSTWRFSRRLDREEGILTYAVFGFFRIELPFVLAEARRRRLLGNVVFESVALLAMLVCFAALNPLGLISFYLPVWLLGTIAAHAQNYLEHYGALPGNRQTDSVSCYGKLYNLLWFNHGYHQEHHYRPQVHWTRIAELRRLLPPESERRVVRWAHWFNFGPVRDDR